MSATTKHPTKAKGMNFTTRKRISSAITSIVMIAIALICAMYHCGTSSSTRSKPSPT